jgi:hypothetical protein
MEVSWGMGWLGSGSGGSIAAAREGWPASPRTAAAGSTGMGTTEIS